MIGIAYSSFTLGSTICLEHDGKGRRLANKTRRRYTLLKHVNDPIKDRDREWSMTVQKVCDKSYMPSYVEESVVHFCFTHSDLLWGARILEATTALTHLYARRFGLNGGRSLEKLCEQVYADRRLVGRYLFRFGTEV